MTHSAKIIAVSLFLTVSLSMHTFAQQSYTDAAAEPAYAKNTMEAEPDHGTNTGLSANPTTEARFSALFPNASNLLWSGGEGNSWVSFVNNGRKAKASFTAKGKMNYIITDCAMQHLPAAFGKTISKDYPGYSLFHAIEIKAHGAVVYQAILENSTDFTTLRYTPDGVEEIQQIKKQ